MKLELTTEQVNLILHSLSMAPYHQVYTLITEIQTQGKAQLRANAIESVAASILESEKQ